MGKHLNYSPELVSELWDRYKNGDSIASIARYIDIDAKGVADSAQVPRRTFYDWWKSRRRAIELIVLGTTAKFYNFTIYIKVKLA